MKNLDSKKFTCTGCFACCDICPQKAIKIIKDDEGFYKYTIDESKCNNCGLCVNICPKIKKKVQNTKVIETFSAYTKNKTVLLKSSSGGIFTELAKSILSNGGVVIGAAWVNNDIKHIAVDSIKDLEKLRGSKYLQSNLQGIYLEISKILKSNKKILFCGTPCQTFAIKQYFNNENIYLVDLVCHGTASKLTFERSLIQRFNVKKSNVDFRNKSSGWNYNFSIKYSNSKFNKTILNSKDGWFKEYLKNRLLKTDCYDCEFVGENRVSDITLGDFWGINKIDKDFYKKNNDKGVSLVLINSKKGKELFKKITNNIVYKKQIYENSIIYNPRIVNGKYKMKYKILRYFFFKRLKNGKYIFSDTK